MIEHTEQGEIRHVFYGDVEVQSEDELKKGSGVSKRGNEDDDGDDDDDSGVNIKSRKPLK